MSRGEIRRGQYGYLGPGGPPPTAEDFSNYCRLRYPGSPRFSEAAEDDRVAIGLTVLCDMPTPWSGSEDDWAQLYDALQARYDSHGELIVPARGASHRAVGSGGADRTGGHPIGMPSHHASNPGVSGGQATPPPPYSHHHDSENRPARRHGEGHETGRRHERRNDGASRQVHGNSQHHGQHHGGRNAGVSREDHGNSRDHRGHNTRVVHENHGHSRHQRRRNPLASYSDPSSSDTSSGSESSYHRDFTHQGGRNTRGFREDHSNPRYQRRGNYSDPSSSDSDGGVSLSTSESQSIDSFSTDLRSTDRQHRMHRQSNALPHRRPRH